MIDARLVTPGGIRKGGRVMLLKGSATNAAVIKVWGEDDFIYATKEARIAAGCSWLSVEEMKENGAWFETFKTNRKKMNESYDAMHADLCKLIAELEDPELDKYVAWTKPKGEGGVPVYTANREVVNALKENVKTLKFIGSSLQSQPRTRTRPELDGRGLPVEVSLEGSNVTEGKNAMIERALSAHGGYAAANAHAIALDAISADNTTARRAHPDADDRVEPDVGHKNMELVRAHNKLNDYYGQGRQHPSHPDLPPDTGELFGKTYFDGLEAAARAARVERLAKLPQEKYDECMERLTNLDAASKAEIAAKRAELASASSSALVASSSTALILPRAPSSSALAMIERGDLSSVFVPPPTAAGPSAESIQVFGAPRLYPRLDLSLPSYERPSVVAIEIETKEERRVERAAKQATLDALPEEEKRALFAMNGAGGDEPLPSFYSRNNNQCPEGGLCYEAHKIAKGGVYRRGRKHFASCPQQKALDLHKRLK